MTNRRNFLTGAGAITGAVAASAVSRVAMAALPEPVLQTKPDTMAPLVPATRLSHLRSIHAQSLFEI